MIYRPKVYTASKLHHCTMWRGMRERYGELEFTARWLDQPEGPDHNTNFWTPAQQRLHWIQDMQDVRRSDWLVAYRAAGDKLSGTIFECGAAAAFGLPILTVGMTDSDSWQALPLVARFDNLFAAFDYILYGRAKP